MKKVAIPILIRRLSSLTEHFAEEVKTEFGSMSSHQLNWQPNDRTWSIAQCLAHLNAYYRYYIPVLKGKISTTRFTDTPDFFTSSPLGVAVYSSVKLGKLKNVKRKLKSTKDYNPIINTSLSLENVIEEYVQHSKDYKEVLKAGALINLRKTKCPLSLRPVVKLNLGDAFVFLTYHNERHVEQMRKLKALKRFPTA